MWCMVYLECLCNHIYMAWASYQIRNIAGCACAGNAGNVFPRRRLQRKPLVSDIGMRHGTCVTHVPWCMSGSLVSGGGKTFPAFPAHAHPQFSVSDKRPMTISSSRIVGCKNTSPISVNRMQVYAKATPYGRDLWIQFQWKRTKTIWFRAEEGFTSVFSIIRMIWKLFSNVSSAWIFALLIFCRQCIGNFCHRIYIHS